MKHTSILVLLLFNFTSYSQNKNTKDKFSHEISTIKGDLNKDNIPDMVVVKQDIKDEKGPYRIQVFLSQPDGSLKLAASSTTLIEMQYPDGKDGYRTGTAFEEVSIKKGILTVSMGLIRGNYKHKFRYQNGNMELIGYSSVYGDGQATITTIDFNLSTGDRYEVTEYMQGVEPNIEKKEKLLIRPLPKLQDIIPFEGDVY